MYSNQPPIRRALGALLALLLGAGLVVSSSPAQAKHPEPDHVRAALDYAAAEWNVSRSTMSSVAHCESKYDVRAVNRSNHVGLFQHRGKSWDGRVDAFRRHVELHNRRHPHQQLPSMTGVWHEAIDAARVTAAYVAGVLPGYKGGWSWWDECI